MLRCGSEQCCRAPGRIAENTSRPGPEQQVSAGEGRHADDVVIPLVLASGERVEDLRRGFSPTDAEEFPAGAEVEGPVLLGRTEAQKRQHGPEGVLLRKIADHAAFAQDPEIPAAALEKGVDQLVGKGRKVIDTGTVHPHPPVVEPIEPVLGSNPQGSPAVLTKRRHIGMGQAVSHRDGNIGERILPRLNRHGRTQQQEKQKHSFHPIRFIFMQK